MQTIINLVVFLLALNAAAGSSLGTFSINGQYSVNGVAPTGSQTFVLSLLDQTTNCYVYTENNSFTFTATTQQYFSLQFGAGTSQWGSIFGSGGAVDLVRATDPGNTSLSGNTSPTGVGSACSINGATAQWGVAITAGGTPMGVVPLTSSMLATNALQASSSSYQGFQLQSSSTSDTITLGVPAGISASYSLTLPTNAGTNGYVLTSNGLGGTSWLAAAGGISAVTATAPLASSGGSAPVISLSGVVAIANGGTNSAAALNNNRMMVSSGGAIVEGPAMTNGQLMIGSTGAAPTAGSLVAGSGITITPGAGSITIAATGAASATSLTGIVPVASGGTGLSTVPTNGQLLIGTGTGYALASLTGSLNEITVTPGAGSIQISTPQAIATTSSPTFAGEILSGLSTAGFVTNTAGGVLGSTPSVALGTQVSGTLPVTSGGTGQNTSYTANNLVVANGTGTALVSGPALSSTNAVNAVIQRDASGNFGANMGTFTSSVQVGSNAASCLPGIAGAIQYTGGVLEFCNGTTWTPLSTSGGGTVSTGTTNGIAYYNSPNSTASGAAATVNGQVLTGQTGGAPLFSTVTLTNTAETFAAAGNIASTGANDLTLTGTNSDATAINLSVAGTGGGITLGANGAGVVMVGGTTPTITSAGTLKLQSASGMATTVGNTGPTSSSVLQSGSGGVSVTSTGTTGSAISLSASGPGGGIALKPNTGGVSIYDSAGVSYMGFKTAASSANILWTLPIADGTGCLQSNGAGVLSIVACGGGGTVSTGTTNGIAYYNSPNSTASGAAATVNGQVLTGQTGGAPLFSTVTLSNTAETFAGAGNISSTGSNDLALTGTNTDATSINLNVTGTGGGITLGANGAGVVTVSGSSPTLTSAGNLKLMSAAGQTTTLGNSSGVSTTVVQSGTGNIQLNGNVGVGGVSATAKLQLPAGVATASGSPLKFTSGANLTVPEQGAMEYDGTNLYYTDSTSSRKTIASTATLANYLPLAGGTLTGGLIDNASIASAALAVTQSGTGYAATFTGGKVGIGTGTPASLLHVYNGEVQVGASVASCAGANAGAIRYSGGSLLFCNGTAWTALSTGASQWTTSGSNVYYSLGNVGIGITTPGGTFDVEGGTNASASGQKIILTSQSSTLAAGAGGDIDLITGAGGTSSTPGVVVVNQAGGLPGSQIAGSFGESNGAGAPAMIVGAASTAHMIIANNAAAGAGTNGANTSGIQILNFASTYASSSGNTSMPLLFLGNIRGTASSPANLQAGDTLGTILFGGYGGSGINPSAMITAIAEDGSWSGTANGTGLSFAVTPVGTTSTNEALHLASTGYVGINTSGPQGILDVEGPLGSGAPIILHAGSSSSSTPGGLVSINAGTSSGTSAGGAITLNAGGASGPGAAAGTITLNAGNAFGSASAGGINLYAGGSNGSATGAGSINISAGSTVTSGAAGSVYLSAGQNQGGSGAAGTVQLLGGQGTSSVAGGAVTISGGSSGTGAGGSVSIAGGTGGTTGKITIGAGGSQFTAMGVCTLTSVLATTSGTVANCTTGSIPASATPAAIHCTPSTFQGSNVAISVLQTGTAGQIKVYSSTTATSSNYVCMWMY